MGPLADDPITKGAPDPCCGWLRYVTPSRTRIVGTGIRQIVTVARPDVLETAAIETVAVQYGCGVPDQRVATQYANDVIRARQSGDVNSERRAFANLAAACRQLGVAVDTLLADAEYRARAQVPPHH
jgi:hypothetical protein